MTKAVAAAALGLAALLPGRGWGQDIRSEKIPAPAPVAKPQPPPERPGGQGKPWTARAVLGMAHDDNITHLLANSRVHSNAGIADDVLHAGAQIEFKPRLGRSLKTEAGYAYDRFDYQRHSPFSYYAHALSADLYPRLSRRWSLDLGGNSQWLADRRGAIADNLAGHAGLLWSAAPRLRLKAGVEYRRGHVRVNRLKDSDAQSLYANAAGVLRRGWSLFSNYRYSASAARGNNYSYHSHAVLLGAVVQWNSRFKTTLVAGYSDKAYDNPDTRFRKVRRDRTTLFSVKPSVAVYSGVEVVAGFTYQQDHSNVSLKSFSDRIYSLALQARL